MYEWLALLSLVLQAATWLLLLGFGAWLYRGLHLRSLPWLGAYAALALPLSLVTPQLIGAVANREGLPAGWSPGQFVAWWTYGEMALGSLTSLLIAVIVVAEVAGLLARLSPGPERGVLRLLRAVRENAVPWGLTLVGLTLAGPLTAAILWLTGPAAGLVRTVASRF